MGASANDIRDHEALRPASFACDGQSPPSNAASAGDFSFVVTRGRSGLESIRDQWHDLVDRLGQHVALAHAPQWYEAYLETTAEPERVYFFAAYRSSELVAIFPFERRTIYVLGVPLPAWVLPYHDHMPFSDVVARPADLPLLLQRLLDALRQEGAWALLIARNILADSLTAQMVEHLSIGDRVSRQKGDCHYLDCGQPYESLLASFSRKHRANLRRHRGNLSALGSVEAVTVTDLAAMDRSFGEFLAVERSGWKGSAGQGTAIALHPELERYYRRLLQAFGARGECELNLLRLDGQCLAAQFCVSVGRTWYLLKIGYDEKYAKYSPGNVLLEDVLIRLCADPEIQVANLASDASWHLNWNPQPLGMADHYLAAPGAVGAVAVSLVRLRMRLVRHVHLMRGRLATHGSALRRLLTRRPAADG